MEDDKIKEQEELKALLNAPDDEGDSSDENQNDDTSADDNKNTPPAKNEDEDSNSDDNTDDNQDNDSGKDDKGKVSKDRWNGKSREEIIKEFEALEKGNTGKEDKAQPSTAKKDKQEDDLKLPPPEELQKMTPTDFAKWVLSRIDEGVKRTIETQDRVRSAVKQEIAEAKKDHPLHDPDYRKMVLTIIDAAGAKGTTVSLKDACKQVDAFLGKHAGQSGDISNDERSRLKKAKAQVESGAGAPAQPDNSDAETDRIQKALGRSGSRGSLGGLGV